MPTQTRPVVTPSPLWAACVCGVIWFIAGSSTVKHFFYKQSGWTTYHSPSHALSWHNADPIQKEEISKLNEEVVYRKVTYHNGTVNEVGDASRLTRATVWTYVIGTMIGLFGGLYGWYVASRAFRCCQRMIESPPPAP